MESTILRNLPVVIALLFITACSSVQREQAARSDLTSKGIPYNATAFIFAAKNGKAEEVKKFLDAGMDVDVNIDGTALTGAAAAKKLEMVKLLLDNGANVNESNYLGSALHAAMYVGSYDIAKTLIDHDADVNLAAEDGATPMVIAAKTGQTKMIELLAKNGADVNYEYPKTRMTPLIYASFNGHLDAVKQLIEAGADVNYKDPTGMTVLNWALLPNNVKIAKALIEAGADVQSDNKRIMLSALCHNDVDFIGYLVKKGIDVNGKAFEKMPLIVWCAKNNLPESAKALIKCGADTKAMDENGSTALDYALMNKEYSLVKILNPEIDTAKLPKKTGDPNLRASKLQFKGSEILKKMPLDDSRKTFKETNGTGSVQHPQAPADEDYGFPEEYNSIHGNDNINPDETDIGVPETSEPEKDFYSDDFDKLRKSIESETTDFDTSNISEYPEKKQPSDNLEETSLTSPNTEKIEPAVVVPGEKPMTNVKTTSTPDKKDTKTNEEPVKPSTIIP